MDAEALRGQLGKLISGFDADSSDADEPDGGVADPFSAPNEWEVRKRVEKKELPKEAASEEAKPKSGSRRAQQAAASAAKQPKDDATSAVESTPGATQPSAKSKISGAADGAASEKVSLRIRLPACASWWEELAPPPAGVRPVGAEELEILQARAEILYEGEVKAQAVAEQRKHGSDHRMMKKLLSAGTAKDKIAALTVQVQESSFHCLPFLRQLIGLAERPAKEVKMAAVEAVCELFLNRLLPPRALVPLHKQPLGSDPSDVHVLQAYFEAELKTLYAAFAEVVLAGTGDTIAHFKQVQLRAKAAATCSPACKHPVPTTICHLPHPSNSPPLPHRCLRPCTHPHPRSLSYAIVYYCVSSTTLPYLPVPYLPVPSHTALLRFILHRTACTTHPTSFRLRPTSNRPQLPTRRFSSDDCTACSARSRSSSGNCSLPS